MRRISLLCLGILLIAVSCASNTKQEPMADIVPSQTHHALIQDGYELVPVFESPKSLTSVAYLLARTGKIEIPIRTIAEFAQVVRDITSEAEALEYVRLLTAQDIRPYLQDAYYAEIHKQTGPDDHWFAIAPERYNAWNLAEPVVTTENNRFVIDRIVAAYPRFLEGRPTNDAALLKIREWVTPSGGYLMEIRDIIAEGDEIYKILVFTK